MNTNRHELDRIGVIGRRDGTLYCWYFFISCVFLQQYGPHHSQAGALAKWLLLTKGRSSWSKYERWREIVGFTFTHRTCSETAHANADVSGKKTHRVWRGCSWGPNDCWRVRVVKELSLMSDKLSHSWKHWSNWPPWIIFPYHTCTWNNTPTSAQRLALFF